MYGVLHKESIHPLSDNDDDLIEIGFVLKAIHGEFYRQYSQKSADADINSIIKKYWKTILCNQYISFTNIATKDVPIEKSQEWAVVQQFGGVPQKSLDAHTTVLISSSKTKSIFLISYCKSQ
jgi:hypothetical protein